MKYFGQLLVLTFCFLLQTAVFASQESPKNQQNCQSTFQSNPEKDARTKILKSMAETLDKSQATPKFRNPQEELQGILTGWGQKTSHPMALQNALPEDIYFVNHVQNYSESIGVVKKNVGTWASFRYIPKDEPLKSTNIGVLSDNLASWMGADKKYLAKKDSNAVMIWMHGGGTRTTGYQTGAQLTNDLKDFGIDVISITLPWHDEGPRHIFRNPNEFFDWVNDIVEKYVPADKPVFLSGHSMGGFLSDLAMRMSVDPNFKLGKRVSGYIPLAPVADFAPGGSKKEKALLEENFEKKQKERYKDMSPVDVEIFEEMIRDGKQSHLTFLFINLMMFYNDWSFPKDMGANLKPALVIVGKGDGLTYVGYEEQFDKYMKPLKNVDLQVIEPIVTKEIKNHAGHVEILDKPTPDNLNRNNKGIKKTGYEVKDLILDFISQVTGKEIIKEKQKAKGKNTGNETAEQQLAKNTGTYASFLALYANNLAFRKFLDDNSYYLEKRQTENFQKLTDVKVNLQKYINNNSKDTTLQQMIDQLYVPEVHSILEKIGLIISEQKQDVAEGLTAFTLPKSDKNVNKEEILGTLKHIFQSINMTYNQIAGNKFIPPENSLLMKEIKTQHNIDASEIQQIMDGLQDIANQHKTLSTQKKELSVAIEKMQKDLEIKNKNLKDDIRELRENVFKNTKLNSQQITDIVFGKGEALNSSKALELKKKSKAYQVIAYMIVKENELVDKMLEKETVVKNITTKFLLELDEKYPFDEIFNTEKEIENMPEDLKLEIENFEIEFDRYLRFRKALPKILHQLSSGINGRDKAFGHIKKYFEENGAEIETLKLKEDEFPEIQKKLVEIYGKNFDLNTQEFSDGSLKELLNLYYQLSDIEKQKNLLSAEGVNFNKDYISKVSYDFFNYSKKPLLSQLIETPLEDVSLSKINKSIQFWDGMWREKPNDLILKRILSFITGRKKQTQSASQK